MAAELHVLHDGTYRLDRTDTDRLTTWGAGVVPREILGAVL